MNPASAADWPPGRGRRGRRAGRRGPDPDLEVAALDCPAGATDRRHGPIGLGQDDAARNAGRPAGAGAGRIAWGGTDIARLSPRELDGWRLRHVGLVFQEAELVPELDVTENVLLPARFSRFAVPDPLRDRAAALIRRVGLATPGRRAAALSSGERQRAGGRPGAASRTRP